MAIIDGEVIITAPYDQETYLDLLFKLDEKETICCLEHVSAMPGQGVTSMFTFGEGFGWLQGVLCAYKIPFELVKPQKWKKEFSITSDKNSSIQVCKRLFPQVPLRRMEKCRTDDDGIAEALLMAEYARRHFGR